MANTERYSIRRRLVFRLSPALAILTTVLYFVVYTHAEQAAERSFDSLLAASALSVADTIQNENGKVTLDLPYSSHAILANRTRSRIFYRVTAPDGSLVTGYGDLAASLPPADSAEIRFAYSDFLETRVRSVTLGRFVSGDGASGWVTIVVAQTMEEQDALAAELLRYSFGPVIATAFLATGLIWLAVQRSLAPLDEIERAIVARDPASLATLDVPVPREIHHLVGALNMLMGRLIALLSRMQNFIGESAHQIRTPLANLRSQVEVALGESELDSVRAHLVRVHRNAVLVSHLANQLLADTMVTHRGEIAKLEPVDLLELAENVIEDSSSGTPVRIDLHIETLEFVPLIMGDRLMLAEALKNLLDNAIKYAGMAGQATVSLAASGDRSTVTLSVQDRGPGIPAKERASAFERFVRGADAGETVGSGLGLAIVSKVVERHGGKLTLTDREGGGLAVNMIFALLPRGE